MATKLFTLCFFLHIVLYAQKTKNKIIFDEGKIYLFVDSLWNAPLDFVFARKNKKIYDSSLFK
jgi:cbb3-type cytochrome oxidase subunit 3